MRMEMERLAEQRLARMGDLEKTISRALKEIDYRRFGKRQPTGRMIIFPSSEEAIEILTEYDPKL